MTERARGGRKAHPQIEVMVQSARWKTRPRAAGTVRRAVAAAAQALSTAPGALAIVLTDDSAIRALNRDWRGHDAPTNVLSFPSGATRPGGDAPHHLGDIVIAYQTVRARGGRRAQAVRTPSRPSRGPWFPASPRLRSPEHSRCAQDGTTRSSDPRAACRTRPLRRRRRPRLRRVMAEASANPPAGTPEPVPPPEHRNLPVPIPHPLPPEHDGFFARLARALLGWTWKSGPTRADIEVVLEVGGAGRDRGVARRAHHAPEHPGDAWAPDRGCHGAARRHRRGAAATFPWANS